MGNWQRRLLLGVLWPVLLLQGRHVRRATPRMPEAAGARSGTSGDGPKIRILLAGDSGAAGVGVLAQEQALCGQLVQCLGRHYTVEWCVLATNGLDSPGLVSLLENEPASRFDIVVLSMGANDATGLCAPLRWVQWQDRLASVIDARFAPRLLVHSAVPPMHACEALPQPLRWFMGQWAHEMNRLLAGLLLGHVKRSIHWHPESTTSTGLAMDGMHPNPQGYALWAAGLSRHILASHSPETLPTV